MTAALALTVGLLAGILIGRFLRQSAPVRPTLNHVHGAFLVDAAGRCWWQP